MWLDSQPTALYRFFDEGGVLLYVGITADVGIRWDAHERRKPWWPQVSRKTVEWFDTRPKARAAELIAISSERPLYNLADSPLVPVSRQLGDGEISLTQLRSKFGEYCARVRFGGERFIVAAPKGRRQGIAVIVPFDLYERAMEALGEEIVEANPDWRAALNIAQPPAPAKKRTVRVPKRRD